MGDAADLRLGIAHGVEALALAGVGRSDAARLAEVDVAGQLAQDQEVEAGDDLGPQGRGAGKLGVDRGRTEVREEPELLAQPQERLFRALRPGQLFVLRPADSAEQDRAGAPGERERCLRQRVAGGVVGRAADRRLGELERETVAGKCAQHPHRLRDDLGADAVAGENRDL